MDNENNENKSVKKRGWIKNVAIIFLLILLLLTFFSNTILTYSLPEVSAQYGQYSSLSASVKLSGSVKANESYKVVYEPTSSDTDVQVQTRKVKSVYVREGDYVEKGQEILVVEGGMSEEAKALRKQYDETKKAYDLALSGDNVNYLQNAKALEAAQERYDEAKKELDRLQTRLDSLLSGAGSESEKADRADEIAKKRKDLEAMRDELTKEISDLEVNIEIAKQEAGEGLSGSLTAENAHFAEVESTYNALKAKAQELSSAVTSLQKNLANMRKANDLTHTIESLRATNDQLYADVETNYEQIMENNAEIAEAQQKLKILGMKEVSDIELFRVEHELEIAEEESAGAQSEYSEYAQIYETAKTEIEAHRKQYAASDKLAAFSAELEKCKAKLDEVNREYDETADIDELKDMLKTAQASAKETKQELDILKAQLSQSNQSTSLDRNEQKKRLDELLAKIEEYENAPETLSVTAPIAGRLVSVYVVPGESVSSGMTVADIEIADKGYTCEVTVSSDEARKIQVGSPVTVSNSWWYSNVEASITQIRSDVQSQGKNKIVIFEIKGDVYEGQQLSFSVGDRSSSYSNVFPNSAIREDVDGKYVLTVESKNTPLGIRYKAKRISIEVIASDDTQSAVSGLMGSEFVITNSTVPISDGQMVRLAEN